MPPPKKILMVSMPSLHFFRWANQLKGAGFEVYWFDVTDGGNYIPKINWIHQITGWKQKYKYPGRFWVKKNIPSLYDFIQRYNEKDTAVVFEKLLNEIKPDLVHSFALYVSCSPIILVMEKYPEIRWMYSSWGSDLFYFQNHPDYLKDIKRVLPRIDFLFSDCNRDYVIAEKYGFQGEFLGVFPGGGGFDFEFMNSLKLPVEERKTILIKGFQGRSGRAIQVLSAIEKLRAELQRYQIKVFGADKEVINFTEKSGLSRWGNLQVLGRILHEEVIKLMGESLIYIGNSDSDGMPNTLLEAICMEVIPIQSNPGGVTEEVILDGKNGCLINDCENSEEIIAVIKKVIDNFEILYKTSHNYNIELSKKWEQLRVKTEVVTTYKEILNT